MDPRDEGEIFDYFCGLWEQKKTGGSRHTPETWNTRADDWEKELAQSSSFHRSLEERVSRVAAYLRGRGLLTGESRVMDIGCGPGRFAVEFAKTAGYVAGMDISPRMLELASAYARERSQQNVSFIQGDFEEADVDALGWTGGFDLVFTSITPAVGTRENLKKAMKISRGYCFNSSFIRWGDSLEQQIAEDVFEKEYTPFLDNRGRFYSLFNLLWLTGYLPETFYHQQSQTEQVKAGEDLARYYARCFSADKTADGHSVARIGEYLSKQASAQGLIQRRTERWYGWMLWDVRNPAAKTECRKDTGSNAGQRKIPKN